MRVDVVPSSLVQSGSAHCTHRSKAISPSARLAPEQPLSFLLALCTVSPVQPHCRVQHWGSRARPHECHISREYLLPLQCQQFKILDQQWWLPKTCTSVQHGSARPVLLHPSLPFLPPSHVSAAWEAPDMHTYVSSSVCGHRRFVARLPPTRHSRSASGHHVCVRGPGAPPTPMPSPDRSCPPRSHPRAAAGTPPPLPPLCRRLPLRVWRPYWPVVSSRRRRRPSDFSRKGRARASRSTSQPHLSEVPVYQPSNGSICHGRSERLGVYLLHSRPGLYPSDSAKQVLQLFRVRWNG